MDGDGECHVAGEGAGWVRTTNEEMRAELKKLKVDQGKMFRSEQDIIRYMNYGGIGGCLESPSNEGRVNAVVKNRAGGSTRRAGNEPGRYLFG
jgi:hypothetical protein